MRQIQGSELLAQQLAHGVTRPNVRYTVISSRFDRVVPVEAALIEEPGVNNVVIQDRVPSARPGHYDMPYDPAVREVIMEALRQS